jgi:uncharacterized protein (DUF2147 family)
MKRHPVLSLSGLSRRTALGRAAAVGAALGLGSRVGLAAAQDAMAGHPIVGVWMVATPIGPSLAVFSADGTNIQGVTTASAGPGGVTFTGAQVGTWEPDGDRRAHFTGVQLHTDIDGTFTGTVTIDGHPRVSEDGQTFIDDAPETTVTIRDAANNVVDVLSGGPPATGVGNPGFPVGTPTAATPNA